MYFVPVTEGTNVFILISIQLNTCKEHCDLLNPQEEEEEEEREKTHTCNNKTQLLENHSANNALS